MMQVESLATKWALSLGLVEAPLFSSSEDRDGSHAVLLDGDRGSFVLSEQVSLQLNSDSAANWAWSSDLPHHVAVDESDVIITRWDIPHRPRRFSRHSVEDNLDRLYEYLRLDHIESRSDVIEHAIDMFRRIRSFVKEQSIPDKASIHIFLFVIASLLRGGDDPRTKIDELIENYALDREYVDIFLSLEENKLNALVEQFRTTSGSPKLVPELLVRHAGSIVFQEAHFEFVQSAPTDLFQLPGLAEVKIDTRGGTHFTPPGLARSITEQAIKELNLGDSVTIFDPACGAGAFLHEALRTLKHIDYGGNIRLVGYDLSSNAVAMACFALNNAKQDWPEDQVTIRIMACDSLQEDIVWPEADAVLMNPPFIAWGNLDSTQREHLKESLGSWYKGRPDFSMAFVEKALRCVKDNGVVGTLLPSSILSMSSSLGWRRHLLETAAPSFIAVLGDHGLFRYATVEVACVVLVKGVDYQDKEYISLWTNERKGATGEALRNLRRHSHYIFPKQSLDGIEDWKIYKQSGRALQDILDWRPRPNRLELVLASIQEASSTTVGDLFNVRQGIRTGSRDSFMITKDEYGSLPQSVRQFFRPVVENENIVNGHIKPPKFVFYPYTSGLPIISNEADLKDHLSSFYEGRLLPNKEDLSGRSSIRNRNWWELSEPRRYLEEPEPKLVSAYFGYSGSFAWDVSGDFVVVQGFAWFTRPKFRSDLNQIEQEARTEYRDQVFRAYLALLNSDLFSLLLAEFCPHVAGGQFNLSKKYVENIPIPNLVEFGRLTPENGRILMELAKEGRLIHSGDQFSKNRINQLVANAYNTPLALWPQSR